MYMIKWDEGLSYFGEKEFRMEIMSDDGWKRSDFKIVTDSKLGKWLFHCDDALGYYDSLEQAKEAAIEHAESSHWSYEKRYALHAIGTEHPLHSEWPSSFNLKKIERV